MTSEQVRSIVASGRFPGPKAPAELVETHISWVILTPAFAFKIKKPVRFPFLDFSTLEKRAFYCREELRLNRRLAPDMYLDVLPIYMAKGGLPEICLTDDGGGHIPNSKPSLQEEGGYDKHGGPSMPPLSSKTGGAGSEDAPLDVAVSMKRMDNSRQMDKLLRQNAVTSEEMETLAKMLVGFHRSAILEGRALSYKPGDNRADFDDLFRLEKSVLQFFGAGAAQQFEAWRGQVGRFLDWHEARLHQRAESGYWVDGHGDLHARNIFLLPEGPLVFDCIEFNPHFRQIDVLNELAFLCMDLDAGGHHELAEVFMAAYSRDWPCIEGPEDESLFLYFKVYRANVRLKVVLMELEQHPSAALEVTANNYWRLLALYLLKLSG